MTSKHVFVDVTQYVMEPATTGVQRVLGDVLSSVPNDDNIVCTAGYLHAGQYSLVHPKVVADLVHERFRDSPDPEAGNIDVWNGCERAKTAAVPVDQLDLLFDMYFLPEPTFRADVLEVAERWQRLGLPCGALVYDALPATHPFMFKGKHQAATDRYYRLIASLDSVSAISSTTLDIVESRLRRKAVPNGRVAIPPVKASASAGLYTAPRFVHVGTIEPRKQIAKILDALEQLNDDGFNCTLQLFGKPGWESDELFARISDLEARHLVAWQPYARDEDISAAVSTAAASLYVSELEGFGLPPVEALALGTPVIVSEQLPAIQDLKPLGQTRLAMVSAESIQEAMRRLLDPTTNAKARKEARQLVLPTHQTFARDLLEWLTLAAA